MSQEYLNKVFDKLFPTTEAFKQKKIASVSKSGISTSNFTSPFPKIKESEIEGSSRKAPVGIDSILKATKKLIAINKGEVDPDERDSMSFRKVYGPDDLISERVRLDAGKIRNVMMYKLSKVKSLKYFPSGVFDSYASGHIIGNPLSLPSEEVNPMFNMDQQSRITVFGPGGISSADSVSEEAQNVHPSQFGVIDPITGPESEKIGVDVRLASNTRIGKDGKLYTMLRDRKTGRKVWMSPDEIEKETVLFPV